MTMPIYEYICKNCANKEEIFQKIMDPKPEFCNSCGAKKTMEKVVSSNTMFQLKGGGWYNDLYSTPKPEALPKPSQGKTNTSK